MHGDQLQELSAAGRISESSLQRGFRGARRPGISSFFSRHFPVPKPDGSWRPVIDLSHLNHFIKIPKFKMDTSHKVLTSQKMRHWVYSIDLERGIPPDSCQSSVEEIPPDGVSGNSLPVHSSSLNGISTAPWLFTKVVRVVISLFHVNGLALFQYRDALS